MQYNKIEGELSSEKLRLKNLKINLVHIPKLDGRFKSYHIIVTTTDNYVYVSDDVSRADLKLIFDIVDDKIFDSYISYYRQFFESHIENILVIVEDGKRYVKLLMDDEEYELNYRHLDDISVIWVYE